jgi:hypothetical protein
MRTNPGCSAGCSANVDPMSWDIYIQDLPDVPTIHQVPSDFRPRPIGDRASLLAGIKELLPAADVVDNDWVFVKHGGIDLSIQLHLEQGDEVRYMVVHVHGGDQCASAVAALLRHLGLRAHDTATGDLFDGFSLDESL